MVHVRTMGHPEWLPAWFTEDRGWLNEDGATVDSVLWWRHFFIGEIPPDYPPPPPPTLH
jgi:hypothetical protein